jgi:hypothetical protein
LGHDGQADQEDWVMHDKLSEPRMYDDRPMFTGPPIEAAYLCAVLAVTDALGNTDHILGRINSDAMYVNRHSVRVWWEKHKEADARRIANELARQELERQRVEKVAAAMAKLTDEERALLNLPRAKP